MEKVVTMTLFRRPKYARRVLDALAACDGIGEYRVLLHVEPGHPEVLAVARSTLLPRCAVVENATHLGCSGNTWSALEHGFHYSDFVIHLEDDTVPARDCLRYFEWARERYRNDAAVFTVTSYIRGKPAADSYHAARRLPWYTPWGWGTWRDRWREMRERWDCVPDVTWDVSLNQLRGRRVEIQPWLARTQNIGAELGQHCPGPEWHRKNQFNEFGAWSVELDPTAPFYEITNSA